MTIVTFEKFLLDIESQFLKWKKVNINFFFFLIVSMDIAGNEFQNNCSLLGAWHKHRKSRIQHMINCLMYIEIIDSSIDIYRAPKVLEKICHVNATTRTI